MGKTLRKRIMGGWGTDNGALVIVDDSKAKHTGREWFKPKRLKPYIKDDVPYKGRYKRGEHLFGSEHRGNTSPAYKLEIANANRSLKKGIRQKLKKELKKEIEQL